MVPSLGTMGKKNVAEWRSRDLVIGYRVQCTVMQCNAVTIQYNTVQCSTIQYIAVQYSSILYNTVQCCTIQKLQYKSVVCMIDKKGVRVY